MSSRVLDRRRLASPATGAKTLCRSAVLYLCKWGGLFHLAAMLTRHCIAIVYYHGFDDGDLPLFRPKMFMHPRTFVRRLAIIKKYRTVIPLRMIAQSAKAGPLPPRPLVLTIDDGMYSVMRHAHPLLRSLEMPYTLYVASYYSHTQTTVFNLAVAYALWKTQIDAVDCDRLGLLGRGVRSIRDSAAREQVLNAVIALGRQLDAADREHLLMVLCQELRVNYDELRAGGRLRQLSKSEISQLASDGADIQLHTHSHQLPVDPLAARQDLMTNRDFLEDCGVPRPTHFCFPSGKWAPEHLEILAEFGIETAVTCDFGINTVKTPRLLLHRFIDGEDITDIEAAARVSGFYYLLRRVVRPQAFLSARTVSCPLGALYERTRGQAVDFTPH